MKEKIKKFLDNGRDAIVIIFILQFILMMFITPNRYDDAVFLENIAEQPILSYIGPRYFDWTSRFLIEFALCGVLKTSKYLWILIESLMVALAAFSISKLFVKDNKKENNTMLLFMILLYPLNVMNSAGWAATTVNYIWPLATMLYALIPIKKIWDGEKVGIINMFLHSAALIFAGNQEQTACILVGTYILFAILMMIKNKKIHPYMVINTLLAIFSIVFILTCPGNYIRQELEVEQYFKDMQMMSVLDKIGVAFTSTVGLLVGEGNLIFVILTLLMSVFVFTTYKENLYRAIAIFPFIVSITSYFGRSIVTQIFPHITSFYDLLATEEVLLTAATANNLLYAVPVMFSMFVIVCLIMTILLIFKNLKNNVALLVFLVGLASRLIIGFSPTVFISGQRTMIFFEFAMIIVAMLVWQELIKKNDKNDLKIQGRISATIKILGAMQYLNILFLILLTQK